MSLEASLNINRTLRREYSGGQALHPECIHSTSTVHPPSASTVQLCIHSTSTVAPPSASTVHPQYTHSASTVHPPSKTFTRATTRGDAQTGHRPEAPSCLLPGQVPVQRISVMLILYRNLPFLKHGNLSTTLLMLLYCCIASIGALSGGQCTRTGYRHRRRALCHRFLSSLGE